MSDTQQEDSEVARLLRQIGEEYESALRGMSGLAYGASKHAFFTHKMNNMGKLQEELATLVDEPIVLIDDLASRVAWTMALAERAEPDIARSLWHRLSLVPFGKRPDIPLARHLTHFIRTRIASWEKDQTQAFLKEVQDHGFFRHN